MYRNQSVVDLAEMCPRGFVWHILMANRLAYLSFFCFLLALAPFALL